MERMLLHFCVGPHALCPLRPGCLGNKGQHPWPEHWLPHTGVLSDSNSKEVQEQKFLSGEGSGPR